MATDGTVLPDPSTLEENWKDIYNYLIKNAKFIRERTFESI